MRCVAGLATTHHNGDHRLEETQRRRPRLHRPLVETSGREHEVGDGGTASTTRRRPSERGYVNGFKIGATHLPVQRWKRYKKEFMHRWREMVIVAVTESLDEIKRLETSVISAFRKYNAFGICINPVSGHPLCLNRLPGGESLNHGHSPFFLYIVRK